MNNDHIASIATDNIGNVVATGYFHSSSITIGNTTLLNTGSGDFFIAKYDSGRNALWAKSASGNAFERGTAVSIDTNGNIIVTGSFYGSAITIDTATLTNLATANFFSKI